MKSPMPAHLKRKPGPKPMADDVMKVTMVLPADLWDWAVRHHEGGSAFVRTLLREARDREQRKASGS
jgi:hypothetical protein